MAHVSHQKGNQITHKSSTLKWPDKISSTRLVLLKEALLELVLVFTIDLRLSPIVGSVYWRYGELGVGSNMDMNIMEIISFIVVELFRINGHLSYIMHILGFGWLEWIGC